MYINATFPRTKTHKTIGGEFLAGGAILEYAPLASFVIIKTGASAVDTTKGSPSILQQSALVSLSLLALNIAINIPSMFKMYRNKTPKTKQMH